MNEKGLYPTLGTSIGPVKASKYEGEDLDPWETNYSITQENGVGLFLPDDKRDGKIVRMDFLKGTRRNIFRWGRQYPLYLPRGQPPGGQPWHKGHFEERWGIVELSKSVPGHVAYPMIYSMFNYLNGEGKLANTAGSAVTTVQSVREIYAGNGDLVWVYVGGIRIATPEELDLLREEKTEDYEQQDVLVNGSRLHRHDESGLAQGVSSATGWETDSNALFNPTDSNNWVSSSGSLLEEPKGESERGSERDSERGSNGGSNEASWASDSSTSEELDLWSDEVEEKDGPRVSEIIDRNIERESDELNLSLLDEVMSVQTVPKDHEESVLDYDVDMSTEEFGIEDEEEEPR